MNTIDLLNHFLVDRMVTTDTRHIPQNAIFFALKGENFNGNLFAKEAIDKGAKIAIVDEKEYEDTQNNIFFVENSLIALQNLARAYRQTFSIPFIGLTGSNGKTTTKELITAVLSQQYKVHATYGNLNNHIGVPLTLLSIPQETEIAVIEMGANHQKEIQELCEIALPDFGYITNFGKAHLEGFGGIEGVIKGKCELYDFLEANHKKVFVNLDDSIQVAKSKTIKQISFSTQTDSDYRIELSESDTSNCIAVQYDRTIIQSHLTGDYNLNNIACAIRIGLYFDLPIELIKNGIENYLPENHRSQIIKKPNYTLLMDAYNANPSSMEASLLNFKSFQGTKTIIIGDMFELGKSSLAEHQAIVDLAKQLNFDQIILLGVNFGKTNYIDPKIVYFEKKNDFVIYLENNPITSENILVKGSHGMRLDQLEQIL